MELEGALVSNEADARLHFWADKIRSLGASEIAGVEKVHKGGKFYSIVLHVYVDTDSEEYFNFIRKLL